ncbi:carbohydrate-binding protein, partial [Corallococcus sp. AB049A]
PTVETPTTGTPAPSTPQLPTSPLPTVGGQTPGTSTPVSNNPNGLPDSSESMAGGCSASGASGTLPFAGALLMLGAVALRRRRAPARALAPRAKR